MAMDGLAKAVYEAGKKKKAEDKPFAEESDIDEMEEGASMGKEMACDDIFSALESKDSSALATALTEFFEMCK